MPWHRLGTVSVTQNSSIVTGVNTAFAANTRIGDAFIGPDGRQYELGNVASDTVISIIPPYLGLTVAGAAYAVTPVNGYQKGLADQVRDWVNTYGPKMAALGTTGNYDILPVGKGGTGIADLSTFIQTLLNDADAPAGRLTLAAAKSGMNSDITALSGLTTALSVQQGGTGGNTQALARAGLGLGAAAVAAILGTVSQTGGVPTGAILEKVVNANGEATKFADGRLILIGPIADFTVAAGAVATVSPPGVFPVLFADTAYTYQAFGNPQTSFDVYGYTGTNSKLNWSATAVYRNGPTAQTIGSGRYLAIGRWYL